MLSKTRVPGTGIGRRNGRGKDPDSRSRSPFRGNGYLGTRLEPSSQFPGTGTRNFEDTKESWEAYGRELAKLGPLQATQRVHDLRHELRELEQSKGDGHGIAKAKLHLAERHLLRVCPR